MLTSTSVMRFCRISLHTAVDDVPVSSPHFQLVKLIGAGKVVGEPANDGIGFMQLKGKHTQKADTKGEDGPDHTSHQK